jgi:pSer/pThr/pTyr-binding forkhead associated (FHA) protein
MSESPVLQVFVFREGNYVGNEVFTEPEIVIGRGDGVDLALDDDLVAYNHALITHENGQATLLKLGSGDIFVNRGQVEHTPITPRDEIQIGAHTLKIKFLMPKTQQPSKPEGARSPGVEQRGSARPLQPTASPPPLQPRSRQACHL